MRNGHEVLPQLSLKEVINDKHLTQLLQEILVRVLDIDLSSDEDCRIIALELSFSDEKCHFEASRRGDIGIRTDLRGNNVMIFEV